MSQGQLQGQGHRSQVDYFVCFVEVISFEVKVEDYATFMMTKFEVIRPGSRSSTPKQSSMLRERAVCPRFGGFSSLM